ncbi:MAG: M48 family metallopeptidase [bacterium]
MELSEIDYSVRRSSRATKPRIDVDLDGVVVVIPENLSLDPESLLDEKRDWVRDKLRDMQALRERIPDRTFEEGATFPFQGEDLELVLEDEAPSGVTENTFRLNRESVRKDGLKSVLESVYREQARDFISGVLDEWTDRIGVQYGQVKIKNQKTLWGSCSSKNNLNFNWRIMMAPEEIGKYVVIHELCHLVHSNHGDEFWKLLSDCLDNPREKARWLKRNSVELIFTEDDL